MRKLIFVCRMNYFIQIKTIEHIPLYNEGLHILYHQFE